MNNWLEEFRVNVRLRLGSWLIIALIASYGILFLNDYQHQLQGEYRQEVEKLSRLQNIVQETAWPQRAEESRARLVQAEGKLWNANSKGLAQATLQSWLDNTLKAVKLAHARLKVEAAADMMGYPEIWKATAQLEGDFEAAAVELLLLKMAESPQWLITERFEVRQMPKPYFVLVISAYFQAAKE